MTALPAGPGATMQNYVMTFTQNLPGKISRKVFLLKSGFGSNVKGEFCAGEITAKSRRQKFCGEKPDGGNKI
jgi:hypothetical protein